MTPTELQQEIQRHESALELFREFLKENEEFIAHDGEPSFAVFLLIRIRKMKNGDLSWTQIPKITKP